VDNIKGYCKKICCEYILLSAIYHGKMPIDVFQDLLNLRVIFCQATLLGSQKAVSFITKKLQVIKGHAANKKNE